MLSEQQRLLPSAMEEKKEHKVSVVTVNLEPLKETIEKIKNAVRETKTQEEVHQVKSLILSIVFPDNKSKLKENLFDLIGASYQHDDSEKEKAVTISLDSPAWLIIIILLDKAIEEAALTEHAKLFDELFIFTVPFFTESLAEWLKPLIYDAAYYGCAFFVEKLIVQQISVVDKYQKGQGEGYCNWENCMVSQAAYGAAAGGHTSLVMNLLAICQDNGLLYEIIIKAAVNNASLSFPTANMVKELLLLSHKNKELSESLINIAIYAAEEKEYLLNEYLALKWLILAIPPVLRNSFKNGIESINKDRIYPLTYLNMDLLLEKASSIESLSQENAINVEQAIVWNTPETRGLLIWCYCHFLPMELSGLVASYIMPFWLTAQSAKDLLNKMQAGKMDNENKLDPKEGNRLSSTSLIIHAIRQPAVVAAENPISVSASAVSPPLTPQNSSNLLLPSNNLVSDNNPVVNAPLESFDPSLRDAAASQTRHKPS